MVSTRQRQTRRNGAFCCCAHTRDSMLLRNATTHRDRNLNASVTHWQESCAPPLLCRKNDTQGNRHTQQHPRHTAVNSAVERIHAHARASAHTHTKSIHSHTHRSCAASLVSFRMQCKTHRKAANALLSVLTLKHPTAISHHMAHANGIKERKKHKRDKLNRTHPTTQFPNTHTTDTEDDVDWRHSGRHALLHTRHKAQHTPRRNVRSKIQ